MAKDQRRLRVVVLEKFLSPKELASLLEQYAKHTVVKGGYMRHDGPTEQDKAAYEDFIANDVTLDFIAKKHGYRSPGSVKSAFERVLAAHRNN